MSNTITSTISCLERLLGRRAISEFLKCGIMPIDSISERKADVISIFFLAGLNVLSEDLSLNAATVIAIATLSAQYCAQFQRISYALKIMLTLLCAETLAQTLAGMTMCAVIEKCCQNYFQTPQRRHVAQQTEQYNPGNPSSKNRPPLVIPGQSDDKPAVRVASDAFWREVEQPDSDEEKEKQAMKALEALSAKGVDPDTAACKTC